jgi:hypothetical protein
VERRSGLPDACLVMPMGSSVSTYVMLRSLPLSISTLVSRFVLTIGSTTSGHLPSCGTCSGWSERSKVIEELDHLR